MPMIYIILDISFYEFMPMNEICLQIFYTYQSVCVVLQCHISVYLVNGFYRFYAHIQIPYHMGTIFIDFMLMGFCTCKKLYTCCIYIIRIRDLWPTLIVVTCIYIFAHVFLHICILGRWDWLVLAYWVHLEFWCQQLVFGRRNCCKFNLGMLQILKKKKKKKIKKKKKKKEKEKNKMQKETKIKGKQQKKSKKKKKIKHLFTIHHLSKIINLQFQKLQYFFFFQAEDGIRDTNS
eukprot:TRINITY_DN3550_c0_g1_i3.p2 TRINITY_DN3550_c0_g1~~TRINITY_DN3550_c0_g1_i3.p2  ORF type:complete len:234 (+),score=10.63 TRINITY_DN3550_c0_g1_i3:682-1383(+)